MKTRVFWLKNISLNAITSRFIQCCLWTTLRAIGSVLRWRFEKGREKKPKQIFGEIVFAIREIRPLICLCQSCVCIHIHVKLYWIERLWHHSNTKRCSSVCRNSWTWFQSWATDVVVVVFDKFVFVPTREKNRNETKHVYKKCKYSCTICLEMIYAHLANWISCVVWIISQSETKAYMCRLLCQYAKYGRPKMTNRSGVNENYGPTNVYTFVGSISVMSYPNNRITRQFIFQMVSHFFRHWKLQKWKYTAKHRTEYK